MSKLFICLLSSLSIASMAEANRVLVVRDFGDASLVQVSGEAKLSADGKSFSVDTLPLSEETAWRHQVWTKPGLLKPHTRYAARMRITFAEERGSHPLLQVLCRPRSIGHPRADTLARTFNGTEKSDLLEIKFSTGDMPDYSLQFHTHQRIKFTVADFMLEQLPDDTCIPIVADAKPYEGSLGTLPKGADEFEVERPHATGGAVVKAADFGFSQDSEHNFTALNKALEHCRDIGASVLELAPGDYRCYDDNVPLKVNNLKDFTLEGKGARFICLRKRNCSMSINGCERVVVRNVKFDWDWERDPLASLVQVVAKTQNSYDLKFLHYDDFPRKDARMAFLSPWNPALKAIGYEKDTERALEMFAGRNRQKTEWVAGNLLRIYQGPGEFEIGQYFRLQHYYYDMNCTNMANNQHLTLEDIDILSTPGHATLISGRQKYTQFIRVNIRAPQDDERRVITCTADHCHVGQSLGYFKMLDCDFSLGADDCLNVHDCSAFCRKSGSHSVITQNARSTMWSFIPGAPLELRHGDYSPSGFKEPIKAVKPIDVNAGVVEITFDKPVPEQLFDGFIIFNWNFNSHNVILRDCYFHDNRARGILLLGHDITVERCRFRHNQMGSIKIETGYTFNVWSEGYGAGNIVVRDCLLEQTDPRETSNDGKARDIYMGVYMKTDPSTERTRYPILHDILFENNTIVDSFGLVAFISSVGNVTFRNNLFINPNQRYTKHSYRGGFHLTHASDVKIVNNTYVKTANVPRPAVTADAETVTGLVVEGNRIVAAANPAEIVRANEVGRAVRMADALNLIPEAAAKPVPNYWCTWATQCSRGMDAAIAKRNGLEAGVLGRDNLNEEIVFGQDGWAHDWEGSRQDMILVLDDGWDVPYGVIPWGAADVQPNMFGSLIPDAKRFPANGSAEPAVRLKWLSDQARVCGWRGLGLWVSCQPATADKDVKLDDSQMRDYWRQRLAWSREAGVLLWKVDWGVYQMDIAYRRMISELAKEVYPDLVIEHCCCNGPFNGVVYGADKQLTVTGSVDRSQADEAKKLAFIEALAPFSSVCRTYDTVEPLNIPTTLERTVWHLRVAGKTGQNMLIGTEDEVYLGTALGCAFGVMRGKRQGRSWLHTGSNRCTEVVRALRLQRLAPAWAAQSEAEIRVSEQRLEDRWYFTKDNCWWQDAWNREIAQSAPAIVSRNCALPQVKADGEAPFVVASLNPSGVAVVAVLPRVTGDYRQRTPLAEVTLTDINLAEHDVAVLGFPQMLRVKLADLGGRKIYMQDLASDVALDVTSLVTVDNGWAVIHGELIRKIGTNAQEDFSAPGVIIAVR